MFKNVLFYILGGLLSQGAIFLVWLILPSLITSTEIGNYNYLMYYVDLILVIILLGGDSVIIRFYHSDYSREVVFSYVFA